MDFKPALCPTCGGSLQLPVDRPSVNCMYCGVTVVVRDAIHAAAVANLPNLLKLARTALQSRNYKEAYDYFTRILEADSENSEAWAGKAEASGLMLGPQEVRLQEVTACFRNALASVLPGDRQRMEERIAGFIDQIVGRYYTHMTAALSPGFAENFYWQNYLAQLRVVIDTLDETHQLIPQDRTITTAMLHVCRRNRDRVQYTNRFTGQRSWRSIPDDMRTFINEKIDRYSPKPEIASSPTHENSSSPMYQSSITSAPITRLSNKQIGFIFLGVLVLTAIVMVSIVGSRSNSNTAASKVFPGSVQEKKYLEATLRYLTVHYDRCKSAATTMASAESGGTSLSEIRNELSTSRLEIGRSWQADFLPTSNEGVPLRFSDLDKRIRNVHDSQMAAFQELLAYWDDRNNKHITRGSEMFKAALLQCDAAIKDLNKILDSFDPKKQ